MARLLNGRQLAGVQFVAESFMSENPGDKKFAGKTIPGVPTAGALAWVREASVQLPLVLRTLNPARLGRPERLSVAL